MRLLNPFGLLGILTVPIIIGLHLHLERNRRVIVSSMFLWSFLDARFEGKKPKFVRLSWLLLLDIMIAVLITLAFARPMILLPSLRGQKYDQVILIDNSTSMLAVDQDLDRFTLAVELADGLIRDSGRDTDTLVATIGGEVKVIGSTREMERQDLSNKLEELSAGGNGVNLREGLSIATAFSDLENPVRVFVITDGAFALPVIDDFTLPIEWVFLGYQTDNQAIINPVLRETDQSGAELFFQVANFSDVDVFRDIVVLVNDIEINRSSLALPAKSLTAQTVGVTGGAATLEVVLVGEDAFPLDDKASFGKISSEMVSVALVTDDPYPLDRAIAANPDADLTLLLPEDYSSASDYDLVIFRDFIPDTLPAGNVLIFDVPFENDKFEITGAAQIDNENKSELIAADHEVLRGINFNSVRWDGYWLVNLSGMEDENYSPYVLLREAENPLFVLLESERQNIFLFLPELEGGNFTSHPAFPVLISNMIEYSRGIDLAPDYLLGDSLTHEDFQEFLPSEIIYPGEDQVVDILGAEQVELDRVGLYTLGMLDVYGRSHTFTFGVNAGSLSESEIAPQDWRVNYLDSPFTAENEIQKIEVDLSPLLLAMATILLVVEAWRAWR